MELKDLLLIISALVNIYALYNSRIVEREKSKLKKTEMLFDLRVAAVREFNEIYQKYNPLNLGELHGGELYCRSLKWEDIRKDISKYRAQYGYIFEDDEVNNVLMRILESMDYGADPKYMTLINNKAEEEASWFEDDRYKEMLILMSEANDMMRKYLFEEAKPEVTLWVKFKRFISRLLCCRKRAEAL